MEDYNTIPSNREYICTHDFQITIQIPVSNHVITARIKLEKGDDAFDVLESFRVAEKIPVEAKDSMQVALAKYLINMKGRFNHQEKSIKQAQCDIPHSIQPPNSENASYLCRRTFSRLLTYQGLQELLKKARQEYKAEVAHDVFLCLSSLESLEQLHFAELELLCRYEGSMTIEAFSKDIKTLKYHQNNARNKMLSSHIKKFENANLEVQQGFLRSVNNTDFLCKISQEQIERRFIESDPVSNLSKRLQHVSTAQVEIPTNDSLYEHGLAACVPDFTDSSKDSTSSSTLYERLPSRNSIKSALTISKNIAEPWLRSIPQSIALISGDAKDCLNDEQESIKHFVETYSEITSVYLGMQTKLKIKLEVATLLGSIYFAVENCYETVSGNCFGGDHQLTCLLLQSSKSYVCTTEFLKASVSAPELFYEPFTKQLQKLKANEFCNITKHTNLGLSVAAVFHVTREHNSLDVAYSKLRRVLACVNSLGFDQVLIPLEDWILPEKQLKHERKTGERTILESKHVDSLFRMVKTALYDIIYKDGANASINSISFLLDSRIPATLFSTYIKAKLRGENQTGSHAGADNSRSWNRVIDELIKQDKRRIVKAKTILSNVFMHEEAE